MAKSVNKLRYFFDKDGGFTVIDDDLHFSSYSYPSSINANTAKKNPALCARDIMTRAIEIYKFCEPEIVFEKYERACAKAKAESVQVHVLPECR